MYYLKRVAVILICPFLICCLSISAGFAQDNNDSFMVVEKMPELKGSIDSLSKEVQYTQEAYDEEIEGRIVVQFIVDEKGEVEDPEIIRGLGHGLDQQALEVIKQAKFDPGKHRGEAVRIQISIPLTIEYPKEPPSPSAPNEDKEKDNFFVSVEEMPSLKGGLASLQKKLKYPEMARKAGIEGKVVVQFIVNEKGKAENPEVIRGIGGGCDEEAKRLIKEEAEFTPGKQRGDLVRVQYSLPITFKLQD